MRPPPAEGGAEPHLGSRRISNFWTGACCGFVNLQKQQGDDLTVIPLSLIVPQRDYMHVLLTYVNRAYRLAEVTFEGIHPGTIIIDKHETYSFAVAVGE